jgi:sulfatase modifying factor 1
MNRLMTSNGRKPRGTDGPTYPWGNNLPDNTLLNYDQYIGDTTELGKYPNGASVYAALDMAGNVRQ